MSLIWQKTRQINRKSKQNNKNKCVSLVLLLFIIIITVMLVVECVRVKILLPRGVPKILQSGFTPTKAAVLFEKINYIVFL